MESLINSLNNIVDHSFLNKTTDDVQKEIWDSLIPICIDPMETMQHYLSLADYFLADEIYKIKPGRFIRWINKRDFNEPMTREMQEKRFVKIKPNPKKLKQGGIVVDIKFKNIGAYILCRSPTNQLFFNIKFDECVIFQKLTTDEALILLANKNISSSTSSSDNKL